MDKMDKDRSLAAQIRLWVTENPGRHFNLNTLDSEVGIYDQGDKNNRWHIIRRLQTEKLVDRYRGSYRVVADGSVPLNWRQADASCIKTLKFPFQLEKYVRILPKNIIVVAGSKDAGKTALLLNFIRLNMNMHKIFYYSSEMGELELKNRLVKFEQEGLCKLDDWKFEARERAFDFQDVVGKNPDDIHIIDFLEVHEDFWQVGGLIFQIWDKLKTGVAIIALQKNPGVEFGLGGSRSIEKARLYLSIDTGKLTIKSGKNWAQEGLNPTNKSWGFKLVGGCKFIIKNEIEDKEEFF